MIITNIRGLLINNTYKYLFDVGMLVLHHFSFKTPILYKYNINGK